MALKPDIPVEVRFHPYFLNPWVPREGMTRDEYLTTKFGSPDKLHRHRRTRRRGRRRRRPDLRGRQDAAAAQHARLPPPDPVGAVDRQGRADEAAADGPLFHRRRRPVRPRGAGAGRGRRRHGPPTRPARCWRATPTSSGSRAPPIPPRTPASTACRPSSSAASRPSPARSRRRCWPTRSSRSPSTANSSWPSSARPPAA